MMWIFDRSSDEGSIAIVERPPDMPNAIRTASAQKDHCSCFHTSSPHHLVAWQRLPSSWQKRSIKRTTGCISTVALAHTRNPCYTSRRYDLNRRCDRFLQYL